MTAPRLSEVHADGAAALADSDIGTLSDERLDAFLESAAKLVQTDSDAATTLLSSIARENARRDRDDMSAQADYLLARADVNLGNLPSALEAIERARSAWLRIGQELSALRTDLGRMHVLDDLGRHDDAIAVGTALVASLERSHSNEPEAAWMRAAALENLGVGHGYLGHHERALEAYGAAEATYRELGFDEDIPRPMANRGVELIELARLPEAVDALRAAAVAFDDLGDRLSTAKCLAFEARAQLLAGNYLGARDATVRSESYLSDQSSITTEYARTQLVRAETLRSLNMHEEAAALFSSLIEQFAEGGLDHDQAAAAFGMAQALADLGRRDESEAWLNRAEQLFRTVGDEPMTAVTKLERSRFVPDAAARELATEAAGVFRQSGRRADEAAALLRLSEVEENPDRAHGLLEETAALIGDRELPHLRWRVDYQVGRRLARSSDQAEARASLERAYAVVDAVRDSVEGEHHRLRFMAGRRRVHEALVGVLLELGDVQGAFEQTDRARARTLIERLTGKVRSGALQSHSQELDVLYSRLLQAPSGNAVSLAEQARNIERATPVVDAPRRPNSELRLAAPESLGCVLTYEILGSEILAYLMVDGVVTVHRNLSSVGRVEGLLARLDAQWRRFGDVGLAARQRRNLVPPTIDLLQRLYLELLAPIPAVLESEKLVVVPVGLLANVPFSALHDGTCHVVERLAVLASPSVTAARALKAPRSGRSRLVVGVEDEHTPWISEEVAAVAGVAAESAVLRDSAATVDAVSAALGSHDIIHLACHGIHRHDNPLFSALRLGDRWLTAAEIGGWSLDGHLVVLSACDSGKQWHLGSQDELMGLSRAFLAAGATAVAVNLWRAEDEATAAIMSDFHRNLETEPSPAGAMRSAQLQNLDRHIHPYLWAPGIVYGAPTSQKEQT